MKTCAKELNKLEARAEQRLREEVKYAPLRRTHIAEMLASAGGMGSQNTTDKNKTQTTMVSLGS